MAVNFAAVKGVFQDTLQEFSNDRVMRLAAALSYYTVFALPPLLVLIIAIAGFVYGDQSGHVQDRMIAEIRVLVGMKGAEAIQAMMENASRPGSGSVLATVLGVITLLIGATGVFIQLQDALNTAWNVEPMGGGIKSLLSRRVLSFGMILGLGFLLLVSLVLTTVVTAFGDYMGRMLPGGEGVLIVFRILNNVIGFGVITLLFAAIFKVMPDAKIVWHDVWVGAAATALLFTIGKFLIGFYLGRSDPGSAFGAAGSLAVVLVWIYYSALIVLLGAEFTKVYARRYGKRILPEDGAAFVVQEKRQVGPDEMAERAPQAEAEPERASRHDWRR